MADVEPAVQSELTKSQSEVLVLTIKAELNEVGDKVLNEFRALWQNRKRFADYTIILNSNPILVHRVVVALWSPKIQGLLDPNSNKLELKVDPAMESSFHHVIKFMYTGKVEKLTRVDLLQILTLADQFQITILKNACGEALADESDAENVAYLLDIAQKFSCDSLKQRCGFFLAENFSDLWDTHKLMEMDLDVWIGIVKAPKVKVRNEESLWEAVVKYSSQFTKEKQTQALSQLAPHILFEAMRIDYCVHQVEPKYGDIPAIHQLLYTLYKNHSTGTKAHTRVRHYDRYYFCFSKSKKGPQMTLSNSDLTATTNVAWNQVQTEQELLPGAFIDFKVDDICAATVNAYAMVIGVGPESFARSGGGAIIGYTSQPGVGWVGGNGEFFPSTVGNCGVTFTKGDVIRVRYDIQGSFSWEQNGKLIKTVVIDNVNMGDKTYFPTVAIAQGTVTIVQ